MKTMQEPVYKRWEDLLPAAGADAEDDPYANLSEKQLSELAMLARMVRLINEGKADAGGSMARNADKLRETFARDGFDADWLLSQRETVRQGRMMRSRNSDVDGKQVRLLGAMLPFSWDPDTGMGEFLLTATIGTCSHVPPPPYNQVARIRTVEPINVTGLAEEQGTPDPWVWAEGTIRYGVSSHFVYRGDGVMRIDAAYSIEPVRIVSASAAELARQAEQARQEAEALLFPSLAELINGK